MYSHDGQSIFVIDGHTHFWDARPENWRNKYGESWIRCFFAYHSALSSGGGGVAIREILSLRRAGHCQ